jgi:hypothetical protein
MRSLRPRHTARKWSSMKSTTAKALLVPASLLSCCLPIHAASNTASASLQIQVTVIPMVQVMPVAVSNREAARAISYNLQPQRTQPAVRQTTIQMIPAQKPKKFSSSSTMVNDRTPAVLQTLTIVTE